MKLTKRAKIKSAAVRITSPIRKRKPRTATVTAAVDANGQAKQERGFRIMPMKQRSAIASMGGSAVAKKYGRKWMAKIGAKGGRNGHQAKAAK
jgi:hypothetical protein